MKRIVVCSAVLGEVEAMQKKKKKKNSLSKENFTK